MPIYEYVCEDCQARYEHLAISGNGAGPLPEVRQPPRPATVLHLRRPHRQRLLSQA